MWLVERNRDMMDEGTAHQTLFVTEREVYARDFATSANIEAEAAAQLKAPSWKRGDTGVEFNTRQKAHIDVLKTIMKLDTWLQGEDYLFCGDFSYEVTEVEVR